MLKTSAFSEAEFDLDLDRELWPGVIPTAPFLPIGECARRSDGIEIFWLPTEKYPRPDQEWLAERFPTAEACVSGFRQAFQQYQDDWRGNQMRTEILASIDSQRRNRFRDHGWLPFTSIGRIYLNATADAISFRCDCGIDHNLQEHGLSIMLITGNWEFGYELADWRYFFSWREPVAGD